VLLALAAAPHPARAQEARTHELPELDSSVGVLDYIKVRFRMADRWTAPADFGSFEMGSNQPQARLRITAPVARNAGLQLNVRGGAILFDYDGVSDFFGTPTTADPFNNLYAWTARLQGAYLLNENWTLFSENERWSVIMEGFGKARWEGGSDMSDGFTGGGSLAVGYTLAKRFRMVLGVSLGNKLLKSGLGVSPVFEFDWRINDVWTLRSYGVGLQIERKFGENLRVFARARLESGTFRLANRVGEVGQGSVRFRQLPAGIGVRWDALRQLRFTLMTGAVAYQQLRVKTENDDKFSSESADPAAFLTLRIDVRD
jgi:hypothetical protein